MMKKTSNIKKENIRTILHEDLEKTKVCAEFVSHALNDESPTFQVIVTGDETWSFQYDPETKRQSAEWKSPQTKKI